MKRILFLLLFVLPALTFGQFRIVGTGLFTTLNDSTYRARVEFRPDLTGNSYNGNQLDTSMLVLSQAGQLYRLDSFFAATSASAWLILVEEGGNWGSPRGQIMVFQTPGKYVAPQAVYAANGATAAMQAGVDTWNAKLLRQIADSTFLWTESYLNIVDSIRFEDNAFSTLRLFQRDGDTLSAPLFPIPEASFIISGEGTATEGKLIWNTQSGTLHLGMAGGIEMPIGQGEAHIVRNVTGINIPKGKVVYISGATGQRPQISLADADGELSSSVTFGVTAEAINNNDSGFVFTSGYIQGINTSLLISGEALWLDTVPGGFTHTKPVAPVHSVLIGYVITQKNNGTIFVKIQNGYELGELHNVNAENPVNRASLYYNAAQGIWRDTVAAILTSDTSGMLSGYVSFEDTLTSIATKANLALKLNATDTMSLSDRIDLKLNVQDTIDMLSSYINRADTSSMLSTYINREDTSAMLSTYINREDTAAMLSTYIKFTDTISLSDRIDEKLNALDTITLSDRIDLKLDSSLIVGYIPWGDTTIWIATKYDLSQYQGKLTLTTLGTEGAPTLIGNTLNIPNYADTSIYNADGTLLGGRTVNLGNNTLTFRAAASANQYVRIGDKVLKVVDATGTLFETSIDPTGISQATGTMDARIDMVGGAIQMRGEDAVTLGGSTSDLSIESDGVIKFRKSASGPVDSLYGKNSSGELTTTINSSALPVSSSTGIINVAEVVVDALGTGRLPWDGQFVVGVLKTGLYLTMGANGQFVQHELIPNGDRGDITTSAGGAVMTIDAGAVTNSKANFTTLTAPADTAAQLLGVTTDGRPNTIGLAGGLTLTNGFLTVTGLAGGTVTSVQGGNGIITDPAPGITAAGAVRADTSVLASKVWANNALALKLNAADTASLSNRINLKLNIADTASMLTNYINAVDTAAMLLPYLRKADTLSMLSTYINAADTAAMLTNYINAADTAAMLSGYIKDSIGTVTSTNLAVSAVTEAKIATGAVRAGKYGINYFLSNTGGVTVVNYLNGTTSTQRKMNIYTYVDSTTTGSRTVTLPKPVVDWNGVEINLITENFNNSYTENVNLATDSTGSYIRTFDLNTGKWQLKDVIDIKGIPSVKLLALNIDASYFWVAVPSSNIDTLNKIATKADLTLKLNAADTASLSNRINLKLNAADTASLSNRINAFPVTYEYTTVITDSLVNIPSGCKTIEIVCIGGGGGGGSGRRGVASGQTVATGGTGGSGAAYSFISLDASAITAQLKITVGAGGTGGAARTTNDTNGENGTNGKASSVYTGATGSPANALLIYAGGGGGGEGGQSPGLGLDSLGERHYGDFSGKTGGYGDGQNADVFTGIAVVTKASGGGGGGGRITAGSTENNGGNGGAAGYAKITSTNRGTTATPNATAGYTPVAGQSFGGGGGGGGASKASGAGGDGGAGVRGGGGGGGGASINGVNSGAGGNGGTGYVRITFY